MKNLEKNTQVRNTFEHRYISFMV